MDLYQPPILNICLFDLFSAGFKSASQDILEQAGQEADLKPAEKRSNKQMLRIGG